MIFNLILRNNLFLSDYFDNFEKTIIFVSSQNSNFKKAYVSSISKCFIKRLKKNPLKLLIKFFLNFQVLENPWTELSAAAKLREYRAQQKV